MTDDQKILRTAWLTEVQAISVYESEIWFYSWSSWTNERKLSLKLFREILSEELHHKNGMDQWLLISTKEKILARIYQWSGYIVGFLIAFLPSRLSWYFHTHAEKQAAKSYRMALDLLVDPSFRLKEILLESIEQETDHARKYEALSVLL
jgi:demethoxyubiquinone hydroxylase (CLK1/Coq7/Cat5 family)